MEHNSERTIYHSPEWREILSSTYGYRDVSYGYDQDRGLIAPAMIVKNIILRKKFLVSLPFSDEAGPLLTGNNGNIEDYFYYLDEIYKRENLDYIEIKGMGKSFLDNARSFGYKECFENFTFRIELSLSDEAIRKNYNQSRKRNLKDAEKSELEVFFSDHTHLDRLYELHQMTMKRLGTPPHKKGFILRMLEFLKNNALIFCARHRKKIVSASVVLFDESLYCARYVMSFEHSEFKFLNAHTLILHEAIKYSKNLGCRYFDFGVSRPGTGTWDSKKRWIRSEPLRVYYLVKGKENAYIDPRKSEFGLFSSMWKKWIPTPIANFIGPCIRGQVGK